MANADVSSREQLPANSQLVIWLGRPHTNPRLLHASSGVASDDDSSRRSLMTYSANATGIDAATPTYTVTIQYMLTHYEIIKRSLGAPSPFHFYSLLRGFVSCLFLRKRYQARFGDSGALVRHSL